MGKMEDCVRKISVICPVYNAEKTLDRSIGSIIGQTFEDWELLLIDDGSTDKSGEIIDRYAARDNRIRAAHQPNGGVCAARNKGINLAGGMWLMFLDADDRYTPEAMEKLLGKAEETGADYVRGKVEKIEGSVRKNYHPKKDGRKGVLRYGRLNSVWGALMRADCIKAWGIEFPLGMKRNEDAVFLWRYLARIERAEDLDEMVYEYIATEGSATWRYDDMRKVGEDLTRTFGVFEADRKQPGVKANVLKIKQKHVVADMAEVIFTWRKSISTWRAMREVVGAWRDGTKRSVWDVRLGVEIVKKACKRIVRRGMEKLLGKNVTLRIRQRHGI